MKNNLIALLIITLILTSCSVDDSFPTVDSGSYGKLTGVVKLQTGEIVEGAKVYTQPQFMEVLTNKSGSFEFAGIPPNTYTVFASKEGYRTSFVTATVAAAYRTNVEIVLEPGENRYNPPDKPFYLKPVNNAVITKNAVEFSWECTHPDSYDLTFEIYFSEVSQEFKRIYGPAPEKRVVYSELINNKNYKWKVVAYDSFGGNTESDVHFFNTKFEDDLTFLYAFYPFDGNPNDRSGNYRHGKGFNLNYDFNRYGVANSSVYLAGTESKEQSYIEVEKKVAQFAFDGDFTISLWVKPNLKSSKDNETHIPIIGQTDLKGDWWYFGITKKLGLEYWSAINFQNTFIGFDHITLKDKEWNHIAVVFVKSKIDSKGTVYLYLNGKLLGEKVSINKMANPNSPLRIGFFEHVSVFSGWIDDLYFITKALSDTEIINLAK